MRDRAKRFYSTLICPICGLKMTIPRPRSRKRKEGHIKTMWCAMCKETRDFIENNYKTLSEREGTE
jgi:hypothetical protein